MAAPSPPPPLALLLLLVLAPSAAAASSRQCAYTLRVKTSCASPARTSDAVSVAFGDAYRNEASAPRLPTSSGPGAGGSRALERCSTDTFRVQGPCGYGVCYLYLRRTGGVGWTPEWVRVYEPTSSTPSTFYFGHPLRNGVWYGTDRCPKTKADADGDEHAAASTDAPRASNSSASPRG